MEKIKIKSDVFAVQDLAEFLNRNSGGDYHIAFDETEKLDIGSLNLEPITLIATGASILTALISGIWSYLGQKNASKIIIVGKNGRRIEIPSETPKELIGEYVELAKQLDIENILVK